VKSSLTVIGHPKLARANASEALAHKYRPAARRKVAAHPGPNTVGGRTGGSPSFLHRPRTRPPCPSPSLDAVPADEGGYVSSGPLTESQARQEAIGGGYFASLAPAKYLLLTTFTQDGKPVATPLRVVVDGDRAYVRTRHPTGQSQRLRHGGWVQVAPCTVLGLVRYGPPLDATARLLDGEEVSTAAAKLADKYHVRHRFLHRLFHWVPRRETVYYELRAYRPRREPRRSAAAPGIGQMTADASQQERVSAIEPVAHGRAHVVIRIRDHDGFLPQVR
jgi:uncharacterized protein